MPKNSAHAITAKFADHVPVHRGDGLFHAASPEELVEAGGRGLLGRHDRQGTGVGVRVGTVVSRITRWGGSCAGLGTLGIDARLRIIDPVQTRDVLGLALAAVLLVPQVLLLHVKV
mgnify:CR=1 FL=1